MGKDQLWLYRALSRARFPKSYAGKIFSAAFLGIHVPLLALLAYFLRRHRLGWRNALRVLSVTASATLGGTLLTLWAMYALSAPTALVSRALRRYLDTGELPDLPVVYTDRFGRLMADVQYTVERLDAAIRHMEEMATRDHVTGVYNRRAAEERLAEDVRRARRGGATLSLALIDLDGLKRINDEHGHRAGDECLTHFADVLRSNLRAGDWTARWGGDEFVVSMWDSRDGQPTKPVLERIAGELNQHPVPLSDGEEVALTFSGGTSRWGPDDDVHKMLSRADATLYRAKAKGGDAVVHAD